MQHLQHDLWLYRVGVFLPGGRDEGLGSHEKEKHDEGADQIGVEHFISHLGELGQPKEIEERPTSFPLRLRYWYMNILFVHRKHHTFLNLPPHLRTLSSMCVSLNTRVSGVMCSLCMRSLLRTSIACLMRLLISLEVDCHMLGSEPFVKEAKIYSERKE